MKKDTKNLRVDATEKASRPGHASPRAALIETGSQVDDE